MHEYFYEESLTRLPHSPTNWDVGMWILLSRLRRAKYDSKRHAVPIAIGIVSASS